MYLADTAEMPTWTKDVAAPEGFYTWGQYTELGPFRPTWDRHAHPVPLAYRIEHEARHNVKARWGHLRRFAANAWRETGEFLFGAFQPIRDAL